jgi:hypothetical protein
MTFWILLALDLWLSIGIARESLPTAIASFFVLGFAAYAIVFLLSLFVPRSRPEVKRIRHYRIEEIDDEYVYYYCRGRKIAHRIESMEHRFTQFEPFVEQVEYREGGLKGLLLFDVYRFCDDFYLYS